MVQAGRVQLELLLLERLTQPKRARARLREAQVVDRLAALAVEERRLLEPERPEHRGVEGERALQLPANEIDVPEPDKQLDPLGLGAAMPVEVDVGRRERRVAQDEVGGLLGD